MSLTLSLRRFRLELQRPHGNAVARFRTREGLEVGLVRDGKLLGVGEASPLPGYSDESVDECERALAQVDTAALAAMLDVGAVPASGTLHALTRTLPPAARFGFETAVLRASSAGDLDAALGADPSFAFVPAMLVDMLDPRDPPTIVRDARTRGCRALKLKVGASLASEFALAETLRRSLGPDVELRFDANRALRPGRDDAWLRAFASLSPCLIEEPFATADIERAFALGLPLALDESLRSLPKDTVRRYLDARAVHALVLKPTVLGLLGALDWMALAHSSSSRAVVSHAYEGPIGRRALVSLARCCREPAPGLDESAFSGAREANDALD